MNSDLTVLTGIRYESDIGLKFDQKKTHQKHIWFVQKKIKPVSHGGKENSDLVQFSPNIFAFIINHWCRNISASLVRYSQHILKHDTDTTRPYIHNTRKCRMYIIQQTVHSVHLHLHNSVKICSGFPLRFEPINGVYVRVCMFVCAVHRLSSFEST